MKNYFWNNVSLAVIVITVLLGGTKMTTASSSPETTRDGMINNNQSENKDLVEIEFHNDYVKPVKVYFEDPNTHGEVSTLILRIATGQKETIHSHPGHTFIVYDMGNIQRDTFVVTENYGRKQFFHIRNYESVEVEFHNELKENEDDDKSSMEIYWVGKENEEVLKGKTEYFNGRVRLETQTGHKFVAYNKDRSYRMEFFVTAPSGQSQLFEFQSNRILLTFKYQSLLPDKRVAHLFWVETIEGDKEKVHRHPVGSVTDGNAVELHSDSNHQFQAFHADENGNLERLLGTYTVTADRGGKQHFIIRDDNEEL